MAHITFNTISTGPDSPPLYEYAIYFRCPDENIENHEKYYLSIIPKKDLDFVPPPSLCYSCVNILCYRAYLTKEDISAFSSIPGFFDSHPVRFFHFETPLITTSSDSVSMPEYDANVFKAFSTGSYPTKWKYNLDDDTLQEL